MTHSQSLTNSKVYDMVAFTDIGAAYGEGKTRDTAKQIVIAWRLEWDWVWTWKRKRSEQEMGDTKRAHERLWAERESLTTVRLTLTCMVGVGDKLQNRSQYDDKKQAAIPRLFLKTNSRLRWNVSLDAIWKLKQTWRPIRVYLPKLRLTINLISTVLV